jgi:hypothetical protein
MLDDDDPIDDHAVATLVAGRTRSQPVILLLDS